MKVPLTIILALLMNTTAFPPKICLNITVAGSLQGSAPIQTHPSIALMKVADVPKLRAQARGQVLVINKWCAG